MVERRSPKPLVMVQFLPALNFLFSCIPIIIRNFNMNKIVKFLKEAQAELKKVTWPTWEEVNRSTIIVFVTVIVFTLFIFFADKAVNFLVQRALG